MARDVGRLRELDGVEPVQGDLLDVPAVLGSASTDLTAGFGGIGRALASGDCLNVLSAQSELPEGGRSIAPSSRPALLRPATLRVLPGPHARMFSTQEIDWLCAQAYVVSPRSNRQGLRLEGPTLHRSGGFDVLSSGVCAGCVQITSDGLPACCSSR